MVLRWLFFQNVEKTVKADLEILLGFYFWPDIRILSWALFRSSQHFNFHPVGVTPRVHTGMVVQLLKAAVFTPQNGLVIICVTSLE